MSAFTVDQRPVMKAVAAIATRKLRRGRGSVVTTVELTEQTGRSGQVLGLLCSNLVDKGMLSHEGPSRYRLTRAGIDELRADFAHMTQREER